jgi:cation:H+ antiporter
MPVEFASLPLWLNAVIFGASAGVVWMAGTRLSYYADAIARETKLGQAVIGLLLLGGVTTLPEIVVAGTASVRGNAPLAINNLLGSFAAQVVILAGADFVVRGRALTAVIPNPVVVLQGTLGILLMALVAAAIVVGDIAFLGAGVWSWLFFVAFVCSIKLITASERKPSWQAIGLPSTASVGRNAPKVEHAPRYLVPGTAIASGAILVLGITLASSGEALSQQTGLGASFFGVIFIAIATSLPEVSTVFAAVRLGRYVMAVSDIFGSNILSIGPIFLVDLLFVHGPILNEVGTFSIVAALLGIILTSIYVAGLIERRDPALFGVGLDSLLVVTVYLAGIGLLYALR